MSQNRMQTRLIRGDGFILWKNHVYTDPYGIMSAMAKTTVEVEVNGENLDLYTLSGKYVCEAHHVKLWRQHRLRLVA